MIAGWRHHRTRTVFSSSHLQVREDDITTHLGESIRYVYVDHPGYALVVPRLADERYLLLCQYRPPVRRFVYEFPSGRIEQGEQPAQAAVRELAEEAGVATAALLPLGSFFTTAGSSNEIAHLFLADVKVFQAPKTERTEQLSTHPLPASEIAAKISGGELTDAVSVLAFMLAEQRPATAAR
jgi:ADP-ribose pyrophosphatase